MYRVKNAIYFLCLYICIICTTLYSFVEYDPSTIFKDLFRLSKTTDQVVFNSIEPLLFDCTMANDVQKSVLHFARVILRHDAGREELSISVAEGLEEGFSGNQLFFIKDTENRLVIKTFSHPFEATGHFKKELAGFEFLSQLQLKKSRFARLKGVGKCVVDGKCYGVIAMSYEKGVNIQTTLFHIARLPQGSLERLLALKTVQKAVEKLGAALAELHQVRVQKNMPLHVGIFEQMKIAADKLALEAARGNVVIDIPLLQSYVTFLMSQLKNLKTTRTIAHGDAHLGNFLYDEQSQRIAMVDYAQISRSINQAGDPIDNPTRDIMSTLDIITANKKIGITTKEINLLIMAFKKGYGPLPSLEEQEFFLLLFRLYYLQWGLKAKKRRPQYFSLQSPLQKLLDYLTEEINQGLKKGYDYKDIKAVQ